MNMKIENMAISNGYKNLTLEDIKKLIKEHEIETIRLEYIDMNGVNRGKLLPACMVEEMFEDGIAFAAAIMVIGFDNSVAEVPGLTEYNYDDMKVIPDPSTFMIMPYLEKTAIILGDLYYHGKKMTQSPRWFLKNMIREYNELGYSPIVASEMEFFLYKKNEKEEPIPYTNHDGNCYTANSRIDPSGFLKKLTSAVTAMNFDVLYMNHEFYAGQYEYNWRHNHALNAADQTAMFKGVCKDIAEMNDLHATFMARPVNENGGSGCHVHLSLNDASGKNVFYDEKDPDGMSQVMKHFVGGVLKHAKALTAFLSPTINCYKRYILDSFAPVYIGWGYDNRTTFVRVPDERGKGSRLEVRAGSAAMNPYLAIGAILAAGLDGIKNRIEPAEIVTTDMYHDTKKQMEIVPKSLYRALRELESDEWLKQCAGEDLINNFIGVKDVEVKNFTEFVTDWEWKMYSYHL